MDSEAEEADDNDDDVEVDEEMDADDRDNSELMSSHNIERYASNSHSIFFSML